MYVGHQDTVFYNDLCFSNEMVAMRTAYRIAYSILDKISTGKSIYIAKHTNL